MSDPTTILYIEDNHDNQLLVRRILEARGYALRICEDGPAGIALARESQPALILIDINIAGMDGYETTTRLRSLPHLRTTPIIAITADARPGTRERALTAGCDGFILKPIDPRMLPRSDCRISRREARTASQRHGNDHAARVQRPPGRTTRAAGA